MRRNLGRRAGPWDRGSILAGCLAALAIVLVVLIAGGVYVYLNWRGWAAAGVQSISAEVVKESGLPQDQKDRLLVEVTRVTDDFKAGKISLAQVKRMGEEIVESPLLPLAGVEAARQNYLEPSDMTADEKAAADRSLQRFARGVYEKKIPKDAIKDAAKPVIELKDNGHWELKDKPTRMELDQFIANVKARADEAGVPDEPFDLNIAEELKKAIDKALAQG